MRRRTYSRATERSWDSAAVGQEGRDAYQAGLPLTANPYRDPGGMACGNRHSVWLLGWRRAEWDVERPAAEAKRERWGRGEE